MFMEHICKAGWAGGKTQEGHHSHFLLAFRALTSSQCFACTAWKYLLVWVQDFSLSLIPSIWLSLLPKWTSKCRGLRSADSNSQIDISVLVITNYIYMTGVGEYIRIYKPFVSSTRFLHDIFTPIEKEPILDGCRFVAWAGNLLVFKPFNEPLRCYKTWTY